MMWVGGPGTRVADQLSERILKHERRLRMVQRFAIFQHPVARAERNRDVFVTDNSVGLDGGDRIAIDLDSLIQLHRDVRAAAMK